MKRWLPFVVPFTLLLVAGVAAKVWTSGAFAPRCDSWTPKQFNELGDEACIRVEGLAHYGVAIQQRVPGDLLREEQIWYLFPVFPRGETQDRAIRLLVRTQRPPDRLLDLEEMIVDGRLEVPTVETVPYGTEDQVGKRGYFFDDGVLVLVPDRIESGEGVWTREP